MPATERTACHNIAINAERMGLYIFRFLRYDEGAKQRKLMKRGMKPLYTQRDLADIRKEIRKRALLLSVPALLMLGGVAALFILRLEALTIALTCLLGVYAVFVYGMLLSPVVCYERHLDEVLNGRVRELTGAFKEMEEGTVVRDGVRYYPVLLNVGNMESEEDDRLFYYDANLPRPDWRRGEMLTVTAHDKAMGAWTRTKA